MRIPDNVHSLAQPAVLRALEVDPATGLSVDDVRQRRGLFGPNELQRHKPRSWVAVLSHQFASVIVYLLAAAAAFSIASGDRAQAAAILVVLAINAAIGFTTEWQAGTSMEALRRLSVSLTRVRRGGKAATIAAQELVPGDIVILEAGDVVMADLRLLSASALQLNEAALTGESLPVDKNAAAIAADAPLAERTSMAYKGTAVMRGAGEGVVTGTGMESEIGKISKLVLEARSEATPLEVRLDRLGRKLIWLMLLLAGLTVLAGLMRGYPVVQIVQTGVALAVAAIPEGLPVVATLCLARGMWQMAQNNAVINRLSSVETLGATTLILTDKTGTLTENRMTVVRYLLADRDVDATALQVSGGDAEDAIGWAIRIGALCNRAEEAIDGDHPAAGDPLELALLEVARRTGFVPDRNGRHAEHAFDPDHRKMAHVHAQGAGFVYAVKGAPEAVIAVAERELTADGPRPLDAAARGGWLLRNHAASAEGLRCLALAMKHADSPDESPYDDLTLVALVGLADPLRAGVAPAITACRRAGIRVVMMTGDHAATAERIARDAGLCGDTPLVLSGHELDGFDPVQTGTAAGRIANADIFARVAPETKLRIVTFFQNAGHVVAMTGDGVNDAPALRKADIGIAMGQRGTQVAREAADMVLRDDAFPTIVAAVRGGRVIFDNIRRFVLYLMSCNLSEVLVVGLAVGASLPAPLLPLQILFLNLVTDVFPAFALGMDRGDASVLNRPPRDPAEPLMRRSEWLRVGLFGGVITFATLCAFLLALGSLSLPADQAVTVAFLTLAMAQLWNVFNARAPGSPLFRGRDVRNPWIWAALALCLLMVAAALFIPGLSALLALPYPGAGGMALAGAMSALPLLFGIVVLARPWPD